jgi:hypothetical protein
MNGAKKRDVSRRKFLRDTAVAVVAAGCFASTGGIREALAQAKAAGRPLLTEANLNAHLPKPDNMKAFRHMVAEVKHDLKGYLARHYYVTPQQMRELDEALTPDVLRQINEGLARCVRERKPVRVTITTDQSGERSADASSLMTKVGYTPSGSFIAAAPVFRLKFEIGYDDEKGFYCHGCKKNC